MDLWIRSQDKFLLLKISNGIEYYEHDNEFYITDLNSEYLLGTYPTKERAIEILDEIQELLSERFCMQNYHQENLIYEMPEE